MDGKTLLVGMPWDLLRYPSIALGTLKALLDREGLPSEVLSLNLAWMEFLCTRREGGRRRFRLEDYGDVARSVLGVGNWIFAVPPYQELREDEDLAYLDYLRAQRVPERTIEKALRMRELVPAFIEQCAEEILGRAPRVVGFTTAFVQNVPSLLLARVLKARDPSLWIVFGGSNCDGPMGEAIHRAFPWVDVVVRGEGEPILPGLLRELLAGGPIQPRPGLCYRQDGAPVVVPQARGGTFPMDRVPAPDYDEFFQRLERCSFRHQLRPQVVLHFEAARGCWWGEKSHCTFCGLNGSTIAFRSKSAGRVLEDVLHLSRRYRQLDLAAVDNILDPVYLRELLPHLRELGLDLRLFFEAKANLDKGQLKLLREAGVRHIQPGIESLSTPILRLMRKGVTALQNVRLLKWCARFGIRPSWNFIYGFPGEPEAEYARMACLMPSLFHLEAPAISPLAIDRFSPYHQRPRELGVELLGPAFPYRFCYPIDPATLNELAYSFAYRCLDGREPDGYAEPALEAIRTWEARSKRNAGALRYRRGPGFLRIEDRRVGVGGASDYVLEDVEARLYLACDAGVTAAAAHRRVQAGAAGLGVEDVKAFLDELVEARLAFEENGRYLSLALPADPDGEDGALESAPGH